MQFSALIKFTFVMLISHKFTFTMPSSAIIKINFAKLSSHQIHIHEACLSWNSHAQSSALINWNMFIVLSYKKIQNCKAQLLRNSIFAMFSSHLLKKSHSQCSALMKFTFVMLISHKFTVTSTLLCSAFINFIFAMISSHKIHIRNSHL